jgi:hypothetical protein
MHICCSLFCVVITVLIMLAFQCVFINSKNTHLFVIKLMFSLFWSCNHVVKQTYVLANYYLCMTGISESVCCELPKCCD